MPNNIDFELLLKDAKFVQAMANATQQVKKLDTSVKKIKTTANNSFQAKNIVKFGAALVGVQTAALAARKAMQVLSRTVTTSLKDFAKFEKGMLAVRTLLDDTSFSGKTAGEGFKQMGKDMTKVLQNIPIDAHDATKALFDITSAQISAADATGVLTAASKLAIAGNAKVSTTTEAVVKSIVSYGLEASDATNIAAKFFTAQKLGLTTVEQLSSGIGTVAASAARMGLSMDETLASIVGATRGGLSARRSFVGLNSALTSISKPGKEAQEIAEKYGITLRKAGIQAAGGFIPFLVDMNKKLKGNEEAFKRIITSARGQRFAGSLLTESGIKGAVDAQDQMGDSLKNTKTLTDNYGIAVEALGNKWDKFTGNLDIVKRELVTGLAPAFKDVLDEGIQGLQNLFEELKTPEAQQSLQQLGASIKAMFDSLRLLTPELQTFITALGGLVAIGTAISDSVVGAISDSSVSMEGAAVTSGKLREAQEDLADVQERLAGGLPKSIEAATKAEEQRLLALVEHLTVKRETQVAEDKLAIATQKGVAADKIRADNMLAHLKRQREEADKLAKQKATAAKKASGEAKVAADQAIKDIEVVREAENASDAEFYSGLSKRIQAAEKFAQAQIKGVELVGLSEKESLDKIFQLKSQKLADDVNAGLLSTEKMLDAQLALNTKHLNDLSALEDKQRDDKAKKDKAALDGFLLLAAKGLSALKSGTDIQGSLSEAQSGLDTAKQGLQDLPSPNNGGLQTAKQNVSDSESTVKILSDKLDILNNTISKGGSQAGQDARKDERLILRKKLDVAKENLARDKKAEAKSRKEFDARNDAITKGLEDIKSSNEAVQAATKARDEEAKSAVVGGVSTAVGAKYGPAAGVLTGAALEALSGSKEDAAAFMDSIVEQIPVLIGALADNAPAIVEAIAKAMPQVAVALALAFTNPEVLSQIAVGMVKGFRDGVLEAMKGISFSDGFTEFIDAFDEAMRVLLLPVIAVGDAIQAIIDIIDELSTNIDKATGGNISSNFQKAVKDPTKIFAATGGIITGQGNRDTVPAMLTPGELVIDRTTGPRLNRFLDSAEGSGSSNTTAQGSTSDSAVLAEILSQVRKPIQVRSDLTLNSDVLGEIILDLDRRNARTTA